MSVFGPPLTSIPAYLLGDMTTTSPNRDAKKTQVARSNKRKTAPRPENPGVPTHVFLITYRNRQKEMARFNEVMPPILDEDIGKDKWAIIYVHQCNKWMFSRGSLFNLGFKEVQRRWPNDWRRIQLVLHDVDIYPTKPGVIDYNCGQPGVARHPYGVKRPKLGGTVGGICVLYGEDYVRVNGSPNFVGWGGEDVALCRRLTAAKVRIDESDFISREGPHPGVEDKDSHPNSRSQEFNLKVTDRRNLTRAMNEDHSQPLKNSGLNSILATNASLRSLLPPDSPYHRQVTMLDVEFEIMDLV